MKITLLALLIFSCSFRENNRYFWTSKLLFANFPKVYFSYPGRFSPKQKKEAVKKEILKFLDQANYQIDIRSYSFNDKDLVEKLTKIRKKGIKINFIGDTKSSYSEILKKNTNFHYWTGGGLHHIKLIVLDNSKVFTGTGNFTEHGLLTDYNGYLSFNLDSNVKFKSFLNEEINFFQKDDLLFLNSPSFGRQIQSLILRELEKANFSIKYLIFDHFDPIITFALKKASEKGLIVKGIYDAPVDKEGKYLSNHFFGAFSNIYEEKNEDKVLRKTRYAGGLLHHKTIIIDDKIVFSGSYNFSQNARDKNRELFFKLNHIFLANEYKKEFERILSLSYKLPQTHFQKNWIDVKKVSTIQNEKICVKKDFGRDIIVELGEGLFKTYLYYSFKNNEKCTDLKNYKSISSGFSYYFSYSFWKDTNLWKNRILYSKDGFKREKNNSLPNVIFDSEKSLEFIDLTFLDKKNLLFQLKTNENFSESYFWFFGKKLTYSKLLKKKNYYSFNLDQTMPEIGFLFFPTKSKNYFTCYQKQKKINSMVEFFLKSYIIYQKTEHHKNYTNLNCFKL